LLTILDGHFSVGCAQNARQYIQYCLRFLAWPPKNDLVDYRNPISFVTTRKSYSNCSS